MKLDARRWAGLAGFLAVVAVAAALGGLSTADASEQYGELEQPSWAPPSWLFGPVWTALYAAMAWSGWRVWLATGSAWSPPLRLFWLQLFLNALWSPLFFALEWRLVALAWILALDAVVVVTVLAFRGRDRLAAVALLPYLAWILFATGLNGAVWWLNR